MIALVIISFIFACTVASAWLAVVKSMPTFAHWEWDGIVLQNQKTILLSASIKSEGTQCSWQKKIVVLFLHLAFHEMQRSVLSCQSSGTTAAGPKPFWTGSQVKSNSGSTIGQRAKNLCVPGVNRGHIHITWPPHLTSPRRTDPSFCKELGARVARRDACRHVRVESRGSAAGSRHRWRRANFLNSFRQRFIYEKLLKKSGKVKNSDGRWPGVCVIY